MALAEYRAKRKRGQTPEPFDSTRSKTGKGQLRFVVQKHAASRLHYDFRLELGGGLKSWAVPKGPSLNPADKRLAMMVEDHPLDYRSFEGVIPKGNYGAGTVMVWDEGIYTDYEESEDPKLAAAHLREGLNRGDLKFVLHGKKLKGAFVLAKMHNDDNAWLLIKKQDRYATPEDVTREDRSVKTKRTLDEIAQSATEKWLHEPELDLGGAPQRKQPDEMKPMMASLAARAFDDPDWLYEVKWDGYRIMAHLKDGAVKLQTRKNQDYTQIYAPIAEELSNLKVDCVLDGEVVVLDKAGKPSFSALQDYRKTGQGNLAYYVFDLPYAGGRDLTQLPLGRRKDIAAQIIEPLEAVRLSDHVEERGSDFFRVAQERGLEGIIAKNANSIYEPGRRSRSWLKLKTHLRQEVVIGGWTEPRGSRSQIGALVLGVYEGGKLIYVGHAGSGLDDKMLSELYERLKPLERQTSPFANEFKTNAPVHWVTPRLVCEASFTEWTEDGHMRHPIFVGLREDKDPKLVGRERPVEPPIETKGDEPKASESKIEITHPDKIFWPKENITKGDLAAYYGRLADTILPYLKDRPQSLNRHPNGISGKSFYQKDLINHPDWVRTEPIYSESNGHDLHWLICNDRDTLLYMANLGSIELHPWHSRIGSLDNPDWCLIDLDAKTNPFDDVIKVAQEARKLLEGLGVPSYPKTSGKTGLHICIPLGAKYNYDQSKLFAEIIVKLLHERLPGTTSVERKPEKRDHLIYLDYLQNRKGQTMAAPYCVRPVPGATVSTPLRWSEVKKGLDLKQHTMFTIERRLEKMGDLWQPVLGEGIDIEKLLEKLSS